MADVIVVASLEGAGSPELESSVSFFNDAGAVSLVFSDLPGGGDFRFDCLDS